MDTTKLRTEVRSLLAGPIGRLGFDLVAVEWLPGRGSNLLRLSIDSPTGVGADDCAAVSRMVSPILDTADPVAGRYTLEVSSPGIDRPVQRRADFERFVGYRVKLRLVEGPPRRRYTGIISALDDDELLLEVDGAEQRIALDLIERAHLVLDLHEYEQLAGGQS